MTNNMIDYTIYVSRAQHPMADEELMRILEESRKGNTDHGITGMLIYIEGVFANTSTRHITSEVCGRFMQVLEGFKDDVDQILSLIRTDPRHSDLTILQQSQVSSRNFESWQMGFKSLTVDEYQANPGYFSLDDTFLCSEEIRSNMPLQFLRSFYQRGMKEATVFQ